MREERTTSGWVEKARGRVREKKDVSTDRGRGRERERDAEEREAVSSWSVLDPVPISRLVIGADSRARCYGLTGCEMSTERSIVHEPRL